MQLRRGEYIPAGCLGISYPESKIDRKAWDDASLKVWRSFCNHQASNPGERCAADDDGSLQHLPSVIQEQLCQLESLRGLLFLFRFRWIDLEFCVNDNGSHGTLRVYLLPDDACHGVVDRASINLRKARWRLLHSLDYSRSAWFEKSQASGENSPIRPGSNGAHGSPSLLHVFNNIPSPSPRTHLMREAYVGDAMNDVLDGSISGLTTRLYPYQRRSTAAMGQKESEPGKVLDPRLVAVECQDGSTWYTDPVVGTVLKEPRYYDGISGGILAEEMGAGKTIICLALILATRNLPTRPPDLFMGGEHPKRSRIGSLADMAALCATRNAAPWRTYFDIWSHQLGYEFSRCEAVLRRNPGYYHRPAPKLRRTGRHPTQDLKPSKIYLSNATVIVVPNNLLAQWKQEIAKHTTGLQVAVLSRHEPIPQLEDLLDLDVILFSQSRFERLVKHEGGVKDTVLSMVHFKRCIVDEGHKLGNSRMGRKSNLLIGLDGMNFTSRWIVTGTPSHGLYGVDDRATSEVPSGTETVRQHSEKEPQETSAEMERKDLERLGSITSLYLKARPWANTTTDNEDTCADWGTYLLLPRHKRNSHGRWECLTTTLDSLIIRHRLSDIGDLLPAVDEKIVVLDGSYQDRLSLNLFAMMIIFNSVQSQRTDMDYFFHPRQRKSLLQIVHNLKQSSFFGGSFFTMEEIVKSVETAEKFLEEGKVIVGEEDRRLLALATRLGQVAIADSLRNLSNRFHEMPILIRGPLGDVSHAWSLDGEGGDTICTSASMVLSLQRLLSHAAGDPEALNSLLNGGLIQEGLDERTKVLAAQAPDKDGAGKEKKSATLAGNTRLGDDSRRRKSRALAGVANPTEDLPVESLPPSLRQINLVSTVSAKLSYLIDSVVRHQESEKIIIFYENDNVAWYLASMLDMVSVWLQVSKWHIPQI